jgi:1-acyl-sn-glycerol-3-phosphate acyltransferase
MNKISAILFFIFINLWGVIIPIIYFFPAVVFRSKKIADKGAKNWAIVVIWFLKNLCKIDYQVKGIENIANKTCIIACKHQSMWETVIMHLIFHRPVYVFKSELLKIPFYGWFLRSMSGIAIDRKGGASSLKNLVKEAKKYLANNQNLIIFPQGTRVPIGKKTDQYPYQAGIAALYSACNVEVIPAALNSGLFWQKGQKIISSGTITIEFLPAIEANLKKDQFLKNLEEAIELKSIDLTKNVK